MKALFILISLLPLAVFSQSGVITGKVTDSKTGEALSNVNVFLSNATKGTQTNADGNFTLTAIKTGQYDLIVSILGYINYSQNVSVNNNKQNINVKLEKRSFELEAVTVRPDPNRNRYLEDFKTEFIGRTINAPLTKIVNPEVISLAYDKDKGELEASTPEFLVVENQGLGYRLKYLLSSFNKNYISGMLYYEGQVLFEELEGSESQQKKWEKNRLEAYLGSGTHFYRALMQDQLSVNGFEPHTLIRKNNLLRPSDSLIRAKIQTFRRTNNKDSLRYWTNKSQLPKIIEILAKESLNARDIVKLTDQRQLYALSFKDYLYVVYTKKRVEQVRPSPGTNVLSSVSFQKKITDPDGHPVSIITLLDPYALFDTNGIIVNPKSLIYEGAWEAGVAEMLPSDYEPGL